MFLEFKIKIICVFFSFNKIKLYLCFLYIFFNFLFLILQNFELNILLKNIIDPTPAQCMKRDFNILSDNNTEEISKNIENVSLLDSNIIIDRALRFGVFNLNLDNIESVSNYLKKNGLAFSDITTPFREIAYSKIDEINKLPSYNADVDIKKIEAIKREALKMHFSETYPILNTLKSYLNFSNFNENENNLSLIKEEISKIQQIEEYLLKHEKIKCHNCIYNKGKMLFIKKY